MTLALPPGWARGAELVPQTIGKSVADVWRAGEFFIKSEPMGPFAELPGEIERLRWLGSTGLPCPAVVDAADHDGRHWLLMTALPGVDLASVPHLPAATAVTIVAHALRAMHGLDPRTCPFDHRRVHRLATATEHHLAGMYDGEGTADADYASLLARQPAGEDLVVTHGDACFPNFMVDGDRFTGFVDCGRLGLADRYQDIALACRSLEHNFGGYALPVFLEAYGVAEPDAEKLAWYNLLDGFF